ncbi:hypothetical protein SLA_1488 [Streptomyces laurentii]|uniref:Uncharacterized protein n=1 Tax=Streptomyces laurentii TaxID=39478 RepID=A0A160NUZ5_STRLU|nr:hypothetical protein SLA_1488 [Streptomyces laurentii]
MWTAKDGCVCVVMGGDCSGAGTPFRRRVGPEESLPSPFPPGDFTAAPTATDSVAAAGGAGPAETPYGRRRAG